MLRVVAAVWLSTDGRGASWTRVNASAFAIADAAMTWLSDTTTNGVIILYDYANTVVYQSTTMGATWTSIANIATIAASQTGSVIPKASGALIFDGDNNLYLVGGSSTPVVWFSANQGSSWTYLPQPTRTTAGVQSVVTLNEVSYSCLSMQYTASSSAPSGFHRNVVVYGGFLNVSIDLDVSASTSCVAPGVFVESVLIDVILTGETASAGADLATPPSNLQASIDFHDPASPANLFSPQYPTCAYDVHALANRSSTPRMWQLGGFSTDFSQMYNRISFTQSNFATVAAYYPSYSGNTTVVSGRVGGGGALLANGNLLWFGGKTSANAGLGSNDVFFSTNNGQSFALSTAAAQWSARTDFSTIVLPLTNTVMIVGGQLGTSAATALNDVYVSTDGQGKVWTAATAIPNTSGFLDAAAVALFDSSSFGGSQAHSTVLLAPSAATTNAIYASTDLGASWAVVSTQPWTYRQRNDLTADVEGYVYASGGADDGNVFFSWNKAVSWSVLQQLSTSTVWKNTVVYEYSHDNCQFLSYTPNALSPNGYHKTLMIYGGGTATANTGVITVSTPSSNCVSTSSPYVVFGELLLPCEIACGYNGTCPSASVSCATAFAPVSSSSGAGSTGAAATSTTASAVTSVSASTAASAASAASSSSTGAAATSASSTAAAGASSASSVTTAASSASPTSPPPASTTSSSPVTPFVSSSSSAGSPTIGNDATRTTAASLLPLIAAIVLLIVA